jgi:hypothetical protein
MKAKSLPRYGEVTENFRYNPVTGEFQRKTSKGWKPMHQKTKGRRIVSYKGVTYAASRIAYLMMTMEDPGALYVDHINGDETDNRWGNLRAVTPSENAINRKTHAKSGHKGIYSTSSPARVVVWPTSFRSAERRVVARSVRSTAVMDSSARPSPSAASTPSKKPKSATSSGCGTMTFRVSPAPKT